jgi:hypothetical protein
LGLRDLKTKKRFKKKKLSELIFLVTTETTIHVCGIEILFSIGRGIMFNWGPECYFFD